MPATKAQIKQFVYEAKNAIAQGVVFKLNSKQRLKALEEIRNFIDCEIDQARVESTPPRYVR